MKKFKIVIIVVVILCPYIVNASTYDITGDAYYVDNVKENEELLEEEVRYKFYKENKIYSDDYYIENKNPIEFPYRSDQYIITDYTEYSKDYPEELPNRIIKSREMYLYKTLKKIRYINLKDVKGSKGYLNINELKLYHNNKQIEYQINCSSCKEIKNINDETLNNYSSIQNDETLTIDLNDYYDVKELNIEMYLSDKYGTDTTSFKIDTEEKDYIDIFVETNMYTKESNSYKLSFALKDYIKNNIYQEEELITEKKLEDSNYDLIDQYKEYSYQDIKYLYYKIEKDYLKDYYKEKEDYIKDELDYKKYYKVRYKNKLLLKDDYKITSYDYNLYDMIEDTTVDIKDISIENNIDVFKNGLYKVTFKYKNFTVDKYIIVDIEEVMESIHFSDNSDIKKAIKITNENKLKNRSKSKKSNKVSISLIMISFLNLFKVKIL